MTIAAWALPRRFDGLLPPEIRLLSVDAESQVRADCYWARDRARRPTLLGLHGLEGSSQAHYLRGLAQKARQRDWNVVLLNQRNCGGTEHLSPGLYHSGLTADPKAVLRALHQEVAFTDLVVAGYSLGGNLALRLSVELADDGDLPLRGVATVSPTIDLSRCVDAIELPGNRLYQWHFVWGLKARMRRKLRLWPGRFDAAPLDRIRTIRQFDDAYTAPAHGFGTAANYYRLASALGVADRVRAPALILAAADDPFVPVDQFVEAPVAGNPQITVIATDHGGHCGFIARDGRDDNRYWAETTVIEFLAGTLPVRPTLSAP